MKVFNPQFLMSLLCIDDCSLVLNVIPDNYHNPCLGDVLRKFGFKQFIIISCDYQFTDILDPAEWEAARNAGKIGISPEGIITLNQPTQDTFVMDGCGREKASEAVQLIDYMTYQTSLDLSDYDYWRAIYDNSGNYRIMFVDCNGIFWLADSYKAATVIGSPASVIGESPGFIFSMTQIPLPQAGDNAIYQVWATQFQLKLTTVVSAAYLPGVLAALGSNVGSS